MKFHTVVVLLLYVNFVFGQKQVQTKPIPDWVLPVESIKSENFDDDGGQTYLLYEIQVNNSISTRYVNYAVRLNNAEGVQDYSDITIEFDPAYEKLILHKLLT